MPLQGNWVRRPLSCVPCFLRVTGCVLSTTSRGGAKEASGQASPSNAVLLLQARMMLQNQGHQVPVLGLQCGSPDACLPTLHILEWTFRRRLNISSCCSPHHLLEDKSPILSPTHRSLHDLGLACFFTLSSYSFHYLLSSSQNEQFAVCKPSQAILHLSIFAHGPSCA